MRKGTNIFLIIILSIAALLLVFLYTPFANTDPYDTTNKIITFPTVRFYGEVQDALSNDFDSNQEYYCNNSYYSNEIGSTSSANSISSYSSASYPSESFVNANSSQNGGGFSSNYTKTNGRNTSSSHVSSYNSSSIPSLPSVKKASYSYNNNSIKESSDVKSISQPKGFLAIANDLNSNVEASMQSPQKAGGLTPPPVGINDDLPLLFVVILAFFYIFVKKKF